MNSIRNVVLELTRKMLTFTVHSALLPTSIPTIMSSFASQKSPKNESTMNILQRWHLFVQLSFSQQSETFFHSRCGRKISGLFSYGRRVTYVHSKKKGEEGEKCWRFEFKLFQQFSKMAHTSSHTDLLALLYRKSQTVESKGPHLKRYTHKSTRSGKVSKGLEVDFLNVSRSEENFWTTTTSHVPKNRKHEFLQNSALTRPKKRTPQICKCHIEAPKS